MAEFPSSQSKRRLLHRKRVLHRNNQYHQSLHKLCNQPPPQGYSSQLLYNNLYNRSRLYSRLRHHKLYNLYSSLFLNPLRHRCSNRCRPWYNNLRHLLYSNQRRHQCRFLCPYLRRLRYSSRPSRLYSHRLLSNQARSRKKRLFRKHLLSP